MVFHAAGTEPIVAALRSLFGTTDLPGLVPGLIVRDTEGWQRSATLAGPGFEVLLASAQREWNARRPAAAALAWKAYSYWLSLPAVLGLLVARRVPLLTGTNVWIRLGDPGRLLTVGLDPDIPIAILPGDSRARPRTAIVVPDEAALLATMRRTLLDEHLVPLAEMIGAAVRLNRRMLLGSLAAGIAATALRVSGAERAATLLAELDLAGLVDLAPDTTGAVQVRRRTCCLAFTLPRPRVCHDCCIRFPPA